MNKTELKIAGTDDFFTQEAYKVLRSNIQFCGQNVRVIAITSCNENEGKTTVSLHLGKSFAELGKKVLVIDADMRKSVMAGRNTDSSNVKGLSEVLTGMEKLDDCLYQTQYETLHLLFSGKYPPNPVELLSSNHFTELLAFVRQNYDYVIIDTPPLGLVIDAAVVSPLCDGAILLLSDGNVRYTQAQNVVSQLEKSGSKLLGVVRNQTSHKKGGYYYRGYYKRGYYKRGYYKRGYYRAENHEENNKK